MSSLYGRGGGSRKKQRAELCGKRGWRGNKKERERQREGGRQAGAGGWGALSPQFLRGAKLE